MTLVRAERQHENADGRETRCAQKVDDAILEHSIEDAISKYTVLSEMEDSPSREEEDNGWEYKLSDPKESESLEGILFRYR